MEHVNVNFEFDFEKALANEYNEYYQDISYIVQAFDSKSLSTEKFIRNLIKINSSVLAKVLAQYNRELLNEI